MYTKGNKIYGGNLPYAVLEKGKVFSNVKDIEFPGPDEVNFSYIDIETTEREWVKSTAKSILELLEYASEKLKDKVFNLCIQDKIEIKGNKTFWQAYLEIKKGKKA